MFCAPILMVSRRSRVGGRGALGCNVICGNSGAPRVAACSRQLSVLYNTTDDTFIYISS